MMKATSLLRASTLFLVARCCFVHVLMPWPYPIKAQAPRTSSQSASGLWQGVDDDGERVRVGMGAPLGPAAVVDGEPGPAEGAGDHEGQGGAPRGATVEDEAAGGGEAEAGPLGEDLLEGEQAAAVGV